MTNSRYHRQTVLPEIMPEGQEKLSRASIPSILCVRAGNTFPTASEYAPKAKGLYVVLTNSWNGDFSEPDAHFLTPVQAAQLRPPH